MLAKTLPTWVRSAEGLPVEFVFVDNAPDGSCHAIVAENLPADVARYLPDDTNPGFAAGCNRAAAQVTAAHLLLLNPDVWLHEDSMSRMLKEIDATPDTPIAVGLHMHDREYTGIDLNLIGLFIDRPERSRRGPLGPSGGAGVFPTTLFRQFGGLYEPMFAWGEDADLAFRMYASGVRTGTLDLALPHAWGHSVEGDTKLSEFRSFLLARNRVLVAARDFTWPLLLCALPLLLVSHMALAVRRALKGLLGSFLRGIGRGLVMAPAARRDWRGPRFGINDCFSYLRRGRKQ
ncbi:glycosyltransferase [Dactylosporangium roseum]|uniref:Glycosyltransferase n=2 Tax=Dactylosporangium roseum TaxID=47989 RepID=A0ABY5Z5W0_9ACTN|nr:glycosyltransferase [Dactylosporangium roseum]UWZ36877.1 glycosyltransferase [Dactylosporangium roseum]